MVLIGAVLVFFFLQSCLYFFFIDLFLFIRKVFSPKCEMQKLKTGYLGQKTPNNFFSATIQSENMLECYFPISFIVFFANLHVCVFSHVSTPHGRS